MNLVQAKTRRYVLHFSQDGKKTLCGADVFVVIIDRFPTEKPDLIQMIAGLHPHAWICSRCKRSAAEEAIQQ